MLAAPWIDQWQYGDQLTHVVQPEPQAKPLLLEQQRGVVSEAYPDAVITEYVSPVYEDQSGLFKVISAEGHALLVFVNPYTGDILGDFKNADRWYSISDEIHGTFLMGESGDVLIEVAAGLGILLLITGLYLHWPKTGRAFKVMLLPKFIWPSIWRKASSGGKRLVWKDIHASAGFYFSAFLLFFLLTGMSWTGIWGAKIVQPYNSFPAEKSASSWQSDSEQAPAVKTHADLSTEGLKEVPWNLELTPVPVSKVMDSNTHSMTLDEVFAKAIDLGFKRTQEGAFSQSFRIALPRDDLGVYSIMAVTMNGDINNPLGDRTVHLDQYSGKVLADIGWKDYNAVAKAMAAGVAFHKGGAGWWNLIFSALVCVGILLLAVTGVVLWWKRRSAKTESLLNPPPKRPLSARSGGEKGVVILTLVTGILFPLSGVAMLLFLIVDGFLSNRVSRNEQEFDLESS